MREPKFKKGDIIKHVLGEKLLIIRPKKELGYYDKNGESRYCMHDNHCDCDNIFMGYYVCKTKLFNIVELEEEELR